MKLTEVGDNKAPQFKGKANSIEELLDSIKDGRFTLDGRHLVVENNFDLSDLQLVSLVGCPRVVKGSFWCEKNELQTLEGGPTEVDLDYICSINALVSLRGAPSLINGNFSCYNNMLPSLNGGPTQVNGVYNCSGNQLTTLTGCARVIKHDLIADNNFKLVSLKGGPNFVGRNIIIRNSKLTSLKNVQLHLPEVHGELYLGEAFLTGPVLGLLLVKGLQEVFIGDGKLQTILNKYLPGGDLLACALELAEAGYEEQAKL